MAPRGGCKWVPCSGLREAGYKGQVSAFLWSLTMSPVADQVLKPLSGLGAARLARHIPYGTFPSVSAVASSLQDRFGAPYEFRFSAAALAGWAERAGTEQAKVVEEGEEKMKDEKEEKKEKKTSWIEIELVGEDDEGIPGEKYKITLPDNSVAEGTLDEKGFARVEGFEKGTCKVCFPNIDKEALEKV